MRVSSLPVAVLVLVFLTAAAAIWVAGIQLSDQTDVLSTRLHLGSALGGLILLAIATNLPEIAIVVSASVSGQTEVAVGNILGGIAIIVIERRRPTPTIHSIAEIGPLAALLVGLGQALAKAALHDLGHLIGPHVLPRHPVQGFWRWPVAAQPDLQEPIAAYGT